MADEKATAGRARKAPVRKPAIFVIEVLDDSGNPVKLRKDQVNVIAATTNADAALDLMEAGEHPFAVFVRAPITSVM